MSIERALTDRWCPAAEVVEAVRDDGSARAALRSIGRAAASAPLLERARLARIAQLIIDQHKRAADGWHEHMDAAPGSAISGSIAGLVGQQAAPPAARATAAIVPGQMVIATAPVRVDLAGGWSDTPPICHELGGTVVNAAVSLGGRQPLQAVAQLCEEPVIRITSVDLGRSVEITRTSELHTFGETLDWSAIPKAALVLSGLVPGDPGDDLGDWLLGVGGGIRLTVFAAVPKGSGLGTSSVLGAAVLAALAGLSGVDGSREAITARTSTLEQLMRTGGGWQDQLGGIVPGVKILRTSPGADQLPSVEPITIPEGARRELSSRMVLYYTGMQRLAANILQQVVGRYLARADGCAEIVGELKHGAERMRDELVAGDIDAFARTLGEYWGLKRRLDPGSTTPEIESLFDSVRDELVGYELPGAGGGGFLLLIARDAGAAGRVRSILGRLRPNRDARLYDAAIDDRGLSVSVV